MNNISQFFERIKNVQMREMFVRTVVQETLKKLTNIEIPLESISFKSGKVAIAGLDSHAKSALFIKREAILKEINSLQTTRIIHDIRW